MKWKDLPAEIQEKMLERQEGQGNKRDPKVFERNISADGNSGGFDWELTPEGPDFWNEIEEGVFDSFYRMYPKYPIVMLVSNNPENPKGYFRRVVFMKKNGKYLAWDSAETIEDAKKTTSIIIWDYAEDIPDLTKEIDEIFYNLKHEVITEKEAHMKVIKAIKRNQTKPNER